MLAPRRRHEAVEVRQSPGDGRRRAPRASARSGARGRQARSRARAARPARSAASTRTRAVTTWWWSGGTTTSTPLSVIVRTPSSTCCSGGKRPGRGAGRRRAGELVDELVRAGRAESAGCGAGEDLLARELHAGEGTRTRLRRTRVTFRLTCANENGGATCSLTTYVAPFAPPEVRQMPLIRVARNGVERRVDAVRLHASRRIAVARDLAVRGLCAAVRHARSGPAMEVDVHLAAPGLLVDEADEEAAVLVDRAEAVPLAADAAVERVRHPARAVHGRADLTRELRPARLPRRGARRRGRRVSGRLRGASAGGEDQRGGRREHDEGGLHTIRVSPNSRRARSPRSCPRRGRS